MKRLLTVSFAAIVAAAAPVHAQVNLGVNNTGLSIGNSPEWRGVRINFRDQDVRQVHGVNITIWQPHQPSSGDYHGIMIGLPSTGGENLSGMGLGLIGLSASNDMQGIMLGGIGMGAGGDITGVGAGLIGLGAGGDVTGFGFGGIGLGVGNDITGIGIGGIGLGAGGDITGIALGGFGLAAGGDIRGLKAAFFGLGAGDDIGGIGIAGFGMGAGGDISGIHVAGFGMGAAGDITGLNIAGFGLGAGGEIRGANISLIGMGARSISGFTVGSLVRTDRLSGLSIVPVHARVQNNGAFKGIGLSAYNEVRGHTTGLTIGLLNYTRTLHGVQLGVLNVVSENPRGRRMLPLVNWNFEQ